MSKIRILFLCTGNSCRSQMAEAWALTLHPNKLEAYSAGTEPHGLNPKTVEVMKEAVIDISQQKSKHMNTLTNIAFDYVITVCDHAQENCPIPPSSTKMIHASFDDPPKLAQNAKTEEEVLGHYRRVRDQIKEFVENLPNTLNDLTPKEI